MSNVTINIDQLFDIPGAVIYDPDKFEVAHGVSTDTRTLSKDDVFFALVGENFDGHKFVDLAVDKGASAVVINESELDNFDEIDSVIITVPDTTIAYGDLARIYRASLKVKVIAVTGSNGKTTLKEMLYSLLSVKYKVVKTEANNNNHIGVPLTIFSCGDDVDYLILEHGTNHFGEIEYTAKISNPDYAVITNIGDSHLEYLKNREGVLKEKAALFSSTMENGGEIFLNVDDPLLNEAYGNNASAMKYGMSDADIVCTIMGHRVDGRPKVKLEYGDRVIFTGIPLWGESNVKNLIPAVAIAIKCGLSDLEIEKGIASFVPAKRRLDVKQYENFIIIDDTYNANPASMAASFEVLKDISAYDEKVVFLGDMFELGSDAVKMHEGLAEPLLGSSVKEVYLIGELMKNLDEKLKSSGVKLKHFSDKNELLNFAENFDKNCKVILVKGSRGMKMEEIVKKLTGEG